ncbi:MAG: ribonuclease P [Candidatus Bathyarchaeota archaeon]|nr:MAG: ribonuclease P [Candidatus Bathyarchaeota archaeon]
MLPKGVRRRYLALKITGEQSVSREDLLNTLWDSTIQLFGEYGASQTDLRLTRYDSEGNHAIIRCSHKTLEMTKAAVASITEIDGRPVAIHIQRVSGTLKALLKQRRT